MKVYLDEKSRIDKGTKTLYLGPTDDTFYTIDTRPFKVGHYEYELHTVKQEPDLDCEVFYALTKPGKKEIVYLTNICDDKELSHKLLLYPFVCE